MKTFFKCLLLTLCLGCVRDDPKPSKFQVGDQVIIKVTKSTGIVSRTDTWPSYYLVRYANTLGEIQSGYFEEYELEANK